MRLYRRGVQPTPLEGSPCMTLSSQALSRRAVVRTVAALRAARDPGEQHAAQVDLVDRARHVGQADAAQALQARRCNALHWSRRHDD